MSFLVYSSIDCWTVSKTSATTKSSKWSQYQITCHGNGGQGLGCCRLHKPWLWLLGWLEAWSGVVASTILGGFQWTVMRVLPWGTPNNRGNSRVSEVNKGHRGKTMLNYHDKAFSFPLYGVCDFVPYPNYYLLSVCQRRGWTRNIGEGIFVDMQSVDNSLHAARGIRAIGTPWGGHGTER